MTLRDLRRGVLDALPGPLAGRLRAWKLHRLLAGFTPRVAVHTYGAGPLTVYLSDPLAVGWYDHDWAELPEIRELRASGLRPGARVFDAGAHQGVVAMMLAREVGAQGQVVAFEPSAHNAAAARRNRDLNGMAQLDVVEAAVSDLEGPIAINQGLNAQLEDGDRRHGRVVVESTTLDAAADRLGVPDVVFVDVEGAECRVLAGASRALAAPADFFVEVHVGCGLEKLGGSVARLLAYFPEDRFTCTARAENDSTFRPFDADDTLLRGRFFLLAQPRREPASPRASHGTGARLPGLIHWADWRTTVSTKPRIAPRANGPYVVTDCQMLKGLVDGKQYASTGTIALCRCGGSKNKPYCDGTHARIGFRDAKSPDRVTDRRDDYRGSGITIHDNRGICAHAGRCTDTLSSVFKLGQEPWIDPGGAAADEIVAAIERCPSGALSYSIDGVEHRDREQEPAVLIVPNGPYAVRGGADVPGVEWGEGASREHFALCRCGQSRNKPFCSGAHWYHRFDEHAPEPKP